MCRNKCSAIELWTSSGRAAARSANRSICIQKHLVDVRNDVPGSAIALLPLLQAAAPVLPISSQRTGIYVGDTVLPQVRRKMQPRRSGVRKVLRRNADPDFLPGVTANLDLVAVNDYNIMLRETQ